MRVDSFAPEQLAAVTGDTQPAGPSLTLRIVGIVRRPLDLGGRGATGGVVVPTRAFVEKYMDKIGSFTGTILRVRTAHGQSDVPGVVAAARRIWGNAGKAGTAGGQYEFSTTSLAIEGIGAQHAVDVTTAGLWILAGVAAAAGLVALALALARYVAPTAVDEDALRAIGVRRVEEWAAATATVVPLAVAGAATAVVAAALASPLFPVGVARQAEPDPGFHIDWSTLGVGFVGVALVVTGVGALAALVATRRRAARTARPGVPTAVLAGAGFPPTVSTGVGFALERRGERSGVPVRAALVGAVVGVLGVVAVLTYASSLDRLASTPALYGWTWDYTGTDPQASGEPCTQADTQLARDPVIGSIAAFCLGNVDVQGHPVNANAFVGIKGAPIAPEIVDGRAPKGLHEIALGRDALDAVGKGVGDSVRVQGNGRSAVFRIVGQAVFPSLGDAVPLSDGATLSRRGLLRLRAVSDGYLVFRFAPGVDRAAAIRHLTNTFGQGEVPPIAPVVPAEVERLRQVDFLVPVLGGFVALVAVVAIGYTLVTAVRRRRHELAILKTIGFDRAQVRATVAWHSTTLAVVGLLLGIPLGIAAGRVLWGLVAGGLGVSTSIEVPVWAIVAAVPAAILLTNLVAAFPGRDAARTSPAVVLRSE